MACGNEKYRALLAFPAVHPDFQRKGIFSELAKKTYNFAKKERYDFIYGVVIVIYSRECEIGFSLVGKLYLHLCFVASSKQEQTEFNKKIVTRTIK